MGIFSLKNVETANSTSVESATFLSKSCISWVLFALAQVRTAAVGQRITSWSECCSEFAFESGGSIGRDEEEERVK